jgi:hypothetical protein
VIHIIIIPQKKYAIFIFFIAEVPANEPFFTARRSMLLAVQLRAKTGVRPKAGRAGKSC